MTDVNDATFSPFRMILGNLTARPLRAVLSILAISIQVILVLMIVGLTTGVVNEWSKRVEGVGADILVQSPNASIFFAFSSAVMQESFGNQLAKLPGVDEVAPTLSLMDQKNFVVIYGIDYKRFNALSKGFLFGSGRPFEAPDEAIADDIVAQSRHLKVGDQITLLGHSFTICGIVAHGKGARFFIPLKRAQDISGAEKRVSVFYVRSKGDTEATRAEILKLEPSNRVRSIAEYMTLMNSSNLPELKPFIRMMVGIGIVISFLVVFLNMHTLVLERTREIGILKALGFSRAGIAQLLLGETLVLTLLGSAFGILLTFLTKAILTETVPTLQIQITNQWLAGSVILAIVGATAGAIYPTLRAASYDPVVALAYE
ncbi:MAG TPA: FtsX-like permease family protein [Candidatus Sulfotelmatobacter sp.]|jgi:putative ABC transport system permease protein|nr:FtsX-like permease family protein [Candidatus Sulfotelmatobacter sp.]